MLSRFGYLAMACAIAISVGCGEKPTTITGKVTYNGEPVEAGAISFRPADGKGQVYATLIDNGVFSIPKAAPGSRVVEVRGTKKVNFGASHEEAARMAAERATANNPLAADVAEAADYIAPDAEGNSKTVEVAPGENTIDFDIKGPPRK